MVQEIVGLSFECVGANGHDGVGEFRVLVTVVQFADALPKTASEKVEKYKLKTMAEAERERLWDREKEGLTISR